MCHATYPVREKKLEDLLKKAILPYFPEFRPLQYSDKELIETFTDLYDPLISELNFTNLYGWHQFKNFSLSLFESGLILQAAPLKQPAFLLPPLGEVDHMQFCRHVQQNKGSVPQIIRFIDDRNKANFKGYTLANDRDYWDYVYNTTDLATLKGRKYSKKRNLIHQFMRKHEKYSLHPIENSIIDELIAFLDKWCQLRQCCGKEYKCQEFQVTRKCLEEWDRLNCQGGYITIEDSIEAFIVAEKLNRQTAVIHFEKANPDIQGLYQVINRDYTARYLQDYTWINREQDIGLPGLRQAKESYNPSHYIKKYTVQLS